MATGSVSAADAGVESNTLGAERARASFDVGKLSALWAGDADIVAARLKAQGLVAQYPVFDRSQEYRQGKYERYEHVCEKVTTLWKLRRSGAFKGLSNSERAAFAELALPMGSNIDIHEGMFMPTIRLQGSPEQQQRWLPAFEHRALLGSYCQTEIGHGSDVAGLETQATFVRESQEFEIHTPTVRASKWWPKGVGRTVTHAVVYARLRLPRSDGSVEDKGVKAFMVQLRDADTGENLPGVRSGDIGPTIGAVASEQGWVIFDRVRVPREAMLCRYGEVLADGSFVVRGGEGTGKRGYSTMMKVRSEFAFMSSSYLGKACAIAVRYCAVRRQFPKQGSPGEDVQVLDYQGVQARTLPWLAAAYALRFTGRKMLSVYTAAEQRAGEGDTSQVAEAHALSSGLKATLTRIGADGIEELRRACGGHGYLQFSGLVELYGDMMLMFTGEGENYMIIQQLTRWLLKGQFSGWASFLADTGTSRCAVADASGWLDTAAQLAALQHRARSRVKDFLAQVAALGSGAVQWDGICAAFAVGEALVAGSFADGVASAEPCLQPVLRALCGLWCLHTLEKNAADLLVDGYVQPQQVVAARSQARALLTVIRPDAVALVDAFGFADNELNSAIGAYDGDVYRRLLDWAAREPMNEGSVVRGWTEHLKPMMEDGRRLLKERTGTALAETGLIQGSAKSPPARL